MKVDVIPTVNEARVEKLTGRSVVVIDVLRCSSTIVTAFIAGCREIIPVETCGQAYSFRDEQTLLAGERFCKKVQGFDFSNSPTEIKDQQLGGKRLVISTTNGTRAIQKSAKSERSFIGSFLNGSSVARELLKYRKDVTLLCAGSRDEFALEDGLCAGFILSKMLELNPALELSDQAFILIAAYQHYESRLLELLLQSTTGKRLLQLGLADDIHWCAKIDVTVFVPVLKDERIFVHPGT
jgi:2-phosphosulfolactate phosphatase